MKQQKRGVAARTQFTKEKRKLKYVKSSDMRGGFDTAQLLPPYAPSGA